MPGCVIMDRLEQYRIFIQVVEARSFIRAANALGIPRSSVSAAVQHLERTLETCLLHRTTRQVSLTLDGQRLLERLTPLLADAEEVEQLFSSGRRQVVGGLHVDVPSRIARRLLAPALPALLAQHPRFVLTLGASDRNINLAQDGVDCVVRVGSVQDSSLAARPFGRVRMVNCASPDYLEQHGHPEHPDNLDRHWAIGYASSPGQAATWDYLDANACLRTVSMRHPVLVNNVETYIACCRAGLGLIQVPRFDVEDLLEERALVEVLPHWPAPPMEVTVLYPHRHQRSSRLRLFIDWLESLLAPHLDKNSS